jgi:hypothetical protein
MSGISTGRSQLTLPCDLLPQVWPPSAAIFICAPMIDTITKKQVAIVSFDQDLKNAKLLNDLGHPSMRVVTYQVTLDPARLSPEGQFVRFGQYSDGLGQGDEMTGWILLDDLTIEEVLAEEDSDGILRPYVTESAERAAA